MNGDSIKKSDTIKKLPFTSKTRTTFVKNKNALGFNDDDEEEVEQIQEVKGFEDNKETEVKPRVKEPLPTIAPIENANWRAAAKKNKQRYVPKQTQQQQPSTFTNQGPEVMAQSATSYGLQIPTKTVETTLNTIEISQSIDTSTSNTINQDKEEKEEEIPKTLETQAIEAIIRESTQTEETNESNNLIIHMDETEALRNDLRDRPDDTTLEDYEKMPVEEFGAALLRGLGWQKGEGIGRNRKNITPPVMAEIKQRESLLGLGAKPQDTEKDDEKDKRASKKKQYSYKDTSLFKKITKRREEKESDRHDRSSSPSNRDYRKYNEERGSSSSRDRREHSNERRSSSSSRDHRDYRDHSERSRSSSSSSSSSSSRSRDYKYSSRSSDDKRSRSKSPRRHSSGRSSRYS
ncbi:unnamed protein product [Cunninghamella echinulata]